MVQNFVITRQCFQVSYLWVCNPWKVCFMFQFIKTIIIIVLTGNGRVIVNKAPSLVSTSMQSFWTTQRLCNVLTKKNEKNKLCRSFISAKILYQTSWLVPNYHHKTIIIAKLTYQACHPLILTKGYCLICYLHNLLAWSILKWHIWFQTELDSTQFNYTHTII